MSKTGDLLKIAFLTSEPSHNKHSHSGSLYYMGKALEKHCGEVTYLDYVTSRENQYGYLTMRIVTKCHFKWQIAYMHLIYVAKKNAKIASQRLAGRHFDVIVAPDCAPEIAFLQTNTPVLLPLDTTFRLLNKYNPECTNLLAFSKSQGEVIEQAAFNNASRLRFSLPGAARSAIEEYGIDPQKVHAILWGANLDHIPPREQVEGKKLSRRCRLLFIGLRWEHKGGDIVYKTLLKLHEMDIEAELIVCGSVPPVGLTHPRMTVIPFLDKNDERQAREIEKLYATSDFLILPTQADCAPNVFREANAFGLPAITSNTGGIDTIIRNEENGYMLPLSARGEDYADLIADIYQDKSRYLRHVQSSRTAFEERLNCNVWGHDVHDILVKECEGSGLTTLAM
jgi:glycosyltransferase involved in cell wall biosynthesis